MRDFPFGKFDYLNILTIHRQFLRVDVLMTGWAATDLRAAASIARDDA
ncbi:hypothetical protein [Azospirillum largimobile]